MADTKTVGFWSLTQGTPPEWTLAFEQAAARDGWRLVSLYDLGPDGAPLDSYLKVVRALFSTKTDEQALLIARFSAAAGEPHAICALKLTAPKGTPE